MEVLLVADDLTGAVDTGYGFARRGHRTVVAVDDAADAGDPTVLAANTDSRYADKDVARAAVARVLGGRDVPIVYKKVDSTLRGNVVAELEAAMAETGADRAIVAPAFPTAGRLTRGGVHQVDGRPLSGTAYADDANPPESERLPDLLSRSRHPVDHVALETVAAGASAIRASLERAGTGEARIATFDATDDEHLASIARAGANLDERVLYVGSGGLAAHVVVPETGSGAGESREGGEPAEGSGVLAVVGSVADATLAALECVPDPAVVELDRETLIAEPEAAGRQAGERAAARLARGERAVLTAARSSADVSATREAGASAGYDASAVADRVRCALASAAGVALEDARPVGLFLTGGDVARAVCEELAIEAIRLTGEAVAEGVPRGRVASGPLAGTPLVTKAGGFGGESTIVTVLEHLDESS